MYYDADTQSAIRAYLEERNDTLKPFFLRHDDRRGTAQRNGENRRLSPQSLWAIVKRYAAAVGADFGPHAFRHLKARTLLNRGAALDQVQDILGHASPETTKQVYAKYAPHILGKILSESSATADEFVADAEAEGFQRTWSAWPTCWPMAQSP
jgi:site-specific recombinase XerD